MTWNQLMHQSGLLGAPYWVFLSQTEPCLLERLLSAHHVVHHPVMKPVDAAWNAKQGRK